MLVNNTKMIHLGGSWSCLCQGWIQDDHCNGVGLKEWETPVALEVNEGLCVMEANNNKVHQVANDETSREKFEGFVSLHAHLRFCFDPSPSCPSLNSFGGPSQYTLRLAVVWHRLVLHLQ